MNQIKILSKINQLEVLAGLIIKEATMLKRELGGVVSSSSPKRGLSDEQKSKLLLRAEKRRTAVK